MYARGYVLRVVCVALALHGLLLYQVRSTAVVSVTHVAIILSLSHGSWPQSLSHTGTRMHLSIGEEQSARALELLDVDG